MNIVDEIDISKASKATKRPYPFLFKDLIVLSFADKKLFDPFFSNLNRNPIEEFIGSNDHWYYFENDIEAISEIIFHEWSTRNRLSAVKKIFKEREDKLLNSVDNFGKFITEYKNYLPSLPLAHFAEQKVEEFVLNKLKEKFEFKKAEEIMSFLVQPLENNFYKQEEYDLVFTDDLQSHVSKYEWIFSKPTHRLPYTIDDALKRKEMIDKLTYLKKHEETKKIITHHIEIAKKALKGFEGFVDLLQFIVFYRTQRTDIFSQAQYFVFSMLQKKAEEAGLSYEDLEFLTAQEISENKIDKSIIEKRKKGADFVIHKSIAYILYDKEKDALRKKLELNIYHNVTEIKGTVASRGTVKGVVKIVHDLKDLGKVEEGNILVASMTSPPMIQAMNKASGFITDEGGITCHAAIISRELKKPCIIGTKIATKVLKDGDLVEVDANKGIVRKLK